MRGGNKARGIAPPHEDVGHGQCRRPERSGEAGGGLGTPAGRHRPRGCQAYPEAAQLAKEYGIKIIYGMEGYIVHDQEQVPAGEPAPGDRRRVTLRTGTRGAWSNCRPIIF